MIRRKPLERDIERAIMDALRLGRRVKLQKLDAGGWDPRTRGIVTSLAPWLREALKLPLGLPFGLEAWIHIPEGFPDLLGLSEEGRWVFVEVKRPGGRFRPLQREFLQAARKAGHIAFSADSAASALRQFDEHALGGVA